LVTWVACCSAPTETTSTTYSSANRLQIDGNGKPYVASITQTYAVDMSYDVFGGKFGLQYRVVAQSSSPTYLTPSDPNYSAFYAAASELQRRANILGTFYSVTTASLPGIAAFVH